MSPEEHKTGRIEIKPLGKRASIVTTWGVRNAHREQVIAGLIEKLESHETSSDLIVASVDITQQDQKK